jgi:hypothetical protein
MLNYMFQIIYWSSELSGLVRRELASCQRASVTCVPTCSRKLAPLKACTKPYVYISAAYRLVSFGAGMLLQLRPHLSYDDQQNAKYAINAQNECE